MPTITFDFVHITLSLGELPALIAKAFCAIVPFC
jgi:hypothetical protein